MDGDGSFIPGSMPAFDRASRTGRFDEGGGSDGEEEDDVGQGYFSKRVRSVRNCVGYVRIYMSSRLVGCVCLGSCRMRSPSVRPACVHHAPPTHTHTPQAVPAGLEMEIALMREERERDKQLKEQ